MQVPFLEFWQRNPALFYGLFFLLGVYFKFCNPFLLFFILFLLLLPFFFPSPSSYARRILFSFFFFLTSCFYTSWIVRYPELPERGLQGTAILNISSLSLKNTAMGSHWNYSGKLLRFIPEDKINEAYFNIPVTVSLPVKELTQKPYANSSYLLKGKLKKTERGRYLFTPAKNEPWRSINNTWSLAEWRFEMKEIAKKYIIKKIHREPARSFLAGIATGDFENRLLSFEFSRFGLQHIMAISGFHFSIVAAILSFFISFLLGRKTATILLMILMSLYFIFLGNAPSIVRAWISCMVGFAALIFKKQTSGLNALGIGLLVVLIANPEMAFHMGFQFSFIATAAILLFFPFFDYTLQFIFPKKSWSSLIKMNSLNRHGYLVIIFFRQAIALTLAVNLIALPLTLFYFQRFPLMGLLYNFFFPLMVSFVMLLFIISMCFDVFLPSFGDRLHHFNETITQFTLDYTYGLPHSLDVYFTTSLSQDAIVLFLVIYFGMGIYLTHFLRKQANVSNLVINI